MSAIEVGRICVKISGRETGKKCVIVNVFDKNFAYITGPKEVTGVRRRRVNVSHIEPTDMKINVQREASDEEIIKALTDEAKMEEMVKIVKPKIS